MNVIRTNIEGVLILEPRLIKTKNGYFFEQFSEKEFNEKVYEVKFCQDNESMNRYGVVRGFHFQRPPFAQNKLNWCVTGKIIDVAVKEGCNYFTFNVPISECKDCGHVVNAPIKECPKCHSKNIKWYTRIIGYLRAINNFGYERQIEASKRTYSKNID